ncbi:MAG: ORF6N domain-containing protein [Fusobacterium gastrosuis]|uniref:ORF6N domain-containing protein n=1 Tax=Fusobacterium gastrosuis TaxID=1755100 RepID=UPI002970127B|nr:ORF6N domain-containing protein [Fusobacteriaceae bacterium]MDY4011413.1 ORF6N domain-containing protein [Fusobacterium gastrosuis]MDY5306360.1 ORF6N domain-containing protein [Fusobacterium gastrosuis]MDY5714046.1 ORF6N domain-containing protein [Fusobacterium gastrosuis]
MKKDITNTNIEIQKIIYSFRGKQVMIDSDLAKLYQVETKVFNQAVKRNINRFPENFRFQLTENEYEDLKSQIVTSSNINNHGGRRYLPYVFTEQGIAMLSAILKSDIAVEISICIMNAFIEMRKFLLSNYELFSRIDKIEFKQLETDKKIEKIFNYIANNTIEEKQKVFFNGQIYDAFSFIIDLIKRAKKKIILIDNYVDIETLNIMCKKNNGVHTVIIGSGKGNLTNIDIKKFNSQYPNLTYKLNNDFHDRFIILDDNEVYHIGASIKDAGKKSFGITKIEDEYIIENIINKVKIY